MTLPIKSVITPRWHPQMAAAPGSPPYAVFVPQHYEPAYAYPLVLWLHAAQDDERSLARIMPRLSLRNYVGAALGWTPLAPDRAPEVARRRPPGPTAPGPTAPGPLPCQLLAQRLAELQRMVQQRLHVRADRIFLIGQREGADAVLELAQHARRQFAGVVAIDASLPADSHSSRWQGALAPPVLFVASAHVPLSDSEVPARHVVRLASAGRPCGPHQEAAMWRTINHWLMERL